MKKPEKPLLLAIAGGTGSGKTTIAQSLAKTFSKKRVILLSLDHYYRDLSDMPLEKRKQQNFDHPSSIESELLVAHIKGLKAGETIERPTYDFVAHTRAPLVEKIGGAAVVIVEGILALYYPGLLPLYDLKVFVDTEADIRLIRRLTRDITERGRTYESVIAQYQLTVKPMHDAFVEPTKQQADIIVPHGFNKQAHQMLVSHIKTHIDQHCA